MTSTYEQIPAGGMAIRPRDEPAEGDGVIAIHEFDIPAPASLPVPLSHDAYEETTYDGLGQMRCVWQRTSGCLEQMRCAWV